MTSERACEHVYGDTTMGRGGYGGQTLTACGLPLAPDETSACTACGHDEYEHGDDYCDQCSMIESMEGRMHVPASPLHAYVPSRWTCAAGHSTEA